MWVRADLSHAAQSPALVYSVPHAPTVFWAPGISLLNSDECESLKLRVMCSWSLPLIISRTQGVAFQRPCHCTETFPIIAVMSTYIENTPYHASGMLASDYKLQLDCFSSFSYMIFSLQLIFDYMSCAVLYPTM